MFTGLVETVGVLVRSQPKASGMDLQVRSALPAGEMSLGESVAVNGACLTVTALDAHTFSAHASSETLHRTNLGALRPGERVNLERALRLGDRLGGHIVQGHVDGQARISSHRPEGEAIAITFSPLDSGLMDLIVEKGSVALDGVSLTVSRLLDTSFEVTVVPWTAQETALIDRPLGWLANTEVDVLAKYVARLLSRGRIEGAAPKRPGGVTLDLLQRTGFWNGDT